MYIQTNFRLGIFLLLKRVLKSNLCVLGSAQIQLAGKQARERD